MPIIPVVRRRRQKGHEFKSSLGDKARPCAKNNSNKIRNSTFEFLSFIS
jgi:hypothetical protein